MKDFLVAYLDEFHYEADIQLYKITEWVTWLKRVGREVRMVQDGGDTYIPMADLYWCMAKKKKSHYYKFSIINYLNNYLNKLFK